TPAFAVDTVLRYNITAFESQPPIARIWVRLPNSPGLLIVLNPRATKAISLLYIDISALWGGTST
ncbi:18213_t:CDS:2, partial [Racocetra persica]